MDECVVFRLTSSASLSADIAHHGTATVDRSIARIVIGTPLDSFPPLFAGLTNAPAQALLTARTLSVRLTRFLFILLPVMLTLSVQLIRHRKLRYLFIAWMAVMILFSLTGLTLVCAVNLLVRAISSSSFC
jgi:hypothetical protein